MASNRVNVRQLLLVGAIASLVAVAGGCTVDRGSDGSEPWMGTPLTELLDDAIAEAGQSGASAAQLDVLERARVSGEVTYEDAKGAAQAVVACFRQGGLEAEYSEMTRNGSYPVPNYAVWSNASDASVDAIVEVCENQEFTWVNKVYQTQPSARQVVGEFVMSKEGELRACLEDYGIQTDPDANGWELAQLALESTDFGQGGQDCLGEAGIHGL